MQKLKIDGLVKSQKSDDKVKSFRRKARKHEGIRRTYIYAGLAVPARSRSGRGQAMTPRSGAQRSRWSLAERSQAFYEIVKITIQRLALALTILFIPLCATANDQMRSAILLQTGQTSCYDMTGNSIDCTGTGQDGEYQKGVHWPDPRFTDHGNGTVTDNVTGLMWTKDAQQIKGTIKWIDALTACNNLECGGYNDWRLPNARELLSLIDYKAHHPALPSNHPFNNVMFIFYWSSTTYDASPNHAWGIYLYNGYAYNYHKITKAYVWPVRGGR